MAIDEDGVALAKEAALNFLLKVDEFENRLNSDKNFSTYFRICGFKETAALRRASMDLTRELANLRRRS
jgi:hypothetical protein